MDITNSEILLPDKRFLCNDLGKFEPFLQRDLDNLMQKIALR